LRDAPQFTFMRSHPRVDGGIEFHSAVESQQVRSHLCLYLRLRLPQINLPD
jgi:hypothetical protein